MILGYCRVSTLQQADESRTSLASQEAVIRGYAMSRNLHHDDVELFVDAGVSGGTPLRKRPQGAILLKTAKRGDTVIASKLDRMFRNSTDALVTAEAFKEAGIHLVLFDLGHDPITSDGMAKLVFTIFAALADAERTRINERVREGKAAKTARGGLAYGVAPYGHRKVGKGRNAMLEIDPWEQSIIRKVQSQARDKSFTLMEQDFARAGITKRDGKPFQKAFLRKIAQYELVPSL